MRSNVLQPIRNRQARLKDSVVRDFSGGLNVLDDDLNLSTKFSREDTNVTITASKSKEIRQGTRLFCDLTDPPNGSDIVLTDSLTVATTNGVDEVTITWPNNPAQYRGQRVVISGVVGSVGGIPDTEINGTHQIKSVPAGFQITLDTTTSATSTTSVSKSMTITYPAATNVIADGGIVNMWYFQGYLVVYTSTGKIVLVDASGNCSIIWSQEIAVSIGTTGWLQAIGGYFDFYGSAAVFNGEMVLCNGTDKPLLLKDPADGSAVIDYLVDIPSGSNTNTPIGRHVIATSDYVLIAGDPTELGRLHISNIGTSGTWFGDSAPNDGTRLDLGKNVESSDNIIRGISRFRDLVVASFSDATVLGTLGIYDGSSNHVPDFSDTVKAHGTLSHRSMVNLGNDVLMLDNVGVPSFTRALFTGTLRPERVSELIDPQIQRMVAQLTLRQADDGIFAVYNSLAQEYMVFVPNGSPFGDEVLIGPAPVQSESICFSYKLIPSSGIKGWTKYRNWNFGCGTVSELGRVFLGTRDGNIGAGKKIYVLGNSEDPITEDFSGDDDYTSDEKKIKFATELPWADFDERMRTKKSKYLLVDTIGDSDYMVKMFIDREYTIGEPDLLLEGVTFDTTNSSGDVTISGWTHPFTKVGQAFFIEGVTSSIGGIEIDNLNGLRNVDSFTSNSVTFNATNLATSTATSTVSTAKVKYHGAEYLLPPTGEVLDVTLTGADGETPIPTNVNVSWPSEFNLAKFRLDGETDKALKFVAIGVAYVDGGNRR